MMQLIGPGTSATAATFLGISTAAPGGGSTLGFLVPMGLILVIFYFLLIRPANKKQKALQEMISSLKSGDKVITTGGIHGVVAGITDELIQLKIASNVRIEISRNAIAALQSPKEDA